VAPETPTGALEGAVVYGDASNNGEDLPPFTPIQISKFGDETYFLGEGAPLALAGAELLEEDASDAAALCFRFAEPGLEQVSAWAAQHPGSLIAVSLQYKLLAVASPEELTQGPLIARGLDPREASAFLRHLHRDHQLPVTPLELRPVLGPGEGPEIGEIVLPDHHGRQLRFGFPTPFALESATVYPHPQTTEWTVLFEIADDQRAEFEELTGRLVGRQMGLFIGDRLVGGPATVNTPLKGAGFLSGSTIGRWTEAEARELLDLLWYGD